MYSNNKNNKINISTTTEPYSLNCVYLWLVVPTVPDGPFGRGEGPLQAKDELQQGQLRCPVLPCSLVY